MPSIDELKKLFAKLTGTWVGGGLFDFLPHPEMLDDPELYKPADFKLFENPDLTIKNNPDDYIWCQETLQFYPVSSVISEPQKSYFGLGYIRRIR